MGLSGERCLERFGSFLRSVWPILSTRTRGAVFRSNGAAVAAVIAAAKCSQSEAEGIGSLRSWTHLFHDMTTPRICWSLVAEVWDAVERFRDVEDLVFIRVTGVIGIRASEKELGSSCPSHYKSSHPTGRRHLHTNSKGYLSSPSSNYNYSFLELHDILTSLWPMIIIW